MKYKIMSFCMVLVFTLCLVNADRAYSRTSQQKLAKSIAHACEGLLLGYSRNPSLEIMLFDTYDAHVYVVRKKKGFYTKIDDVIEAQGIITRGYIQAIARNPSLSDRFDEIVQMCIDDINDL